MGQISRWVLVLVVAIAAGCTKEATEPVQTVDWYLAHLPEMKTMREKCGNNPGELGMTPNCLNAQQAYTKRAFAPPTGPSVWDTPANPANKPK